MTVNMLLPKIMVAKTMDELNILRFDLMLSGEYYSENRKAFEKQQKKLLKKK